MANSRSNALKQVQNRRPIAPPDRPHKTSEIFAANVFTDEAMQQYLPKDVYKKLQRAIDQGHTVDRDIAESVASGIKNWAIEKGATHYTHWFQPLTGLTAEKHDAFLTIKDGQPLEVFSGENLAQQEPDASSLPSGGIRNTFEARGYTAWDPSSPAFIFENNYGKTLCIPTIFVSYTGEALDFKAPLLKSIEALNDAAVAVCKFFDRNVNRVTPTLGVEQEYFLVDRAFMDLRPDLGLTGRTVIGAPPARGQQLDDHYFGSISERVFAFMTELELESYKLGIPVTTRHNEVAPSQFECAPLFEEQNVAVDHNLLFMDLLDRVARKHQFRVLLHEKPYAGINGSGKHNNWSMATDTGKNLLSPGSAPKENLQFLTFFINTIKAVYEYADLLRAAIATAGNDHRLGANEAPPAIISVFIGSQLSKVLDEIEKPSRKKNKDTPKSYIRLGIPKVPEILLDNTDRNRTSPFAFTGNKFEFRAVGSSDNTAGPMLVLNAIVSNQLREFKKTVDRKVVRGKKKEVAILEVLRAYVKDSKAIRFEGNGYSKEWEEEAAGRGLSNVKQTPRALDAYVAEEAVKLFSKLDIFGPTESHARHEIRLEQYSTKINIEARLMEEMLSVYVIPASVSYLTQLGESVEALQDIDAPKASYQTQMELIEEVSEALGQAHRSGKELTKALEVGEAIADARDQAIHYGDVVVPIMAQVREAADKLEFLVADDLWPLPKYREMLFMR
ncbi:MAG: glutamine synthetase III [Bacteroidota bacterium]